MTPYTSADIAWIEQVCRWASYNRWRLSVTVLPSGTRIEWFINGHIELIRSFLASNRQVALYRACSELCHNCDAYPAGPCPRFFP